MNNCVNLIKLTIQNNKKGFIINNNKNNLNILKSFLKLNIIKLIIIKENKILVFIKYNKNGKPSFDNIINLYKPSNKLYINYKTLNKINFKHKWILILSTSKGILNNSEALKLRSGGLIIAKIWN